MTVRGGSRSASAVNSAPPMACGAKPMLNASAVRNADRVCAYTSTDRPRISNSKPSTYMSMRGEQHPELPDREHRPVRRACPAPGGAGLRRAGFRWRSCRHRARQQRRGVLFRPRTKAGGGWCCGSRYGNEDLAMTPVRAVAAVGADPGAAHAGRRAAPAGRAGAAPVAGSASGDRYQALARDTDLGRDPRAAPARLGRGLPVPGAGERVHHDRRPARPGPGDAHRSRRSARSAQALGRQPGVGPRHRAHPDRRPRPPAYVADVLAAAWQALLEPEWPDAAGHPRT